MKKIVYVTIALIGLILGSVFTIYYFFPERFGFKLLPLAVKEFDCEYKFWMVDCPSTYNGRAVDYCSVNAILKQCFYEQPENYILFSPYGKDKYKVAGSTYTVSCRQKVPIYQTCWTGKEGWYQDWSSPTLDLKVGQHAEWESAQFGHYGTCSDPKYTQNFDSWAGWRICYVYKTEEGCTAKWLDEYRCSNNVVQRKYQNSDCSTVWKDWENCDEKDGCYDTTYRDYYCSDGKCVYKEYPNDSRCVGGVSGTLKIVFIGIFAMSLLALGVILFII